MDFPKNYRYTKDHEWVELQGEKATLGITQFAQEELGEIVFVELPSVGDSFSKGDSICVVESTKAASDVYSALGGTVSEVNGILADQPELVNSHPHDKGWLVKLEGVNAAEFEGLMSADEYRNLIESK